MIFYNHDREVITDFISYSPRTCFIMTHLADPIPTELKNIRKALSKELSKRNIQELDANSSVNGRDFLNKIWRQVLSVPMGIAVVTDDMSISTLSNIFYEVGVLNALGKETIVIKSKGFKIPSDFVRTEYIEFNGRFSERINKFLNQMDELAEHYHTMAENLEANPVLTIDYYKRAFLISGKLEYIDKIKKIFLEEDFDYQTRFGIKNFLSTEKKFRNR